MNVVNKPTLFELLKPRLSAEDDPDLWSTALLVLTDEFTQQLPGDSVRRDSAIVVGVCSHWVRPHNSRWPSAGSFAYPQGYKDSVPQFDWCVVFVQRNGEWESTKRLPGKNVRVFRVAIPAHTMRHRHAAIHTQWTPKSETVLYGFRKAGTKWECVAASDEKTKGHINLNVP